MSVFSSVKTEITNMKEDRQFANKRKKYQTAFKNFLIGVFKLVMIIGLSYVILGPLIGIFSKSFFSDSDQYNSMVFVIPQNPTFARYIQAFKSMHYLKALGYTGLYVIIILVINVLVCSMVGYGFARFEFPLKTLFFALVVVMIVIPTHTIMLPLYVTFRKFNLFGLGSLFGWTGFNMMQTPWPMFILALFGCGLRSGLYIYIFNQFFRGLPKEIEEAAFVDGAGMFYTYFAIMLRNAMPSVITVAVFSLVWQYADTFYAKLFQVGVKGGTNRLLSMNISTLQATISNALELSDPNISILYLDAGIVLVILPVLIMYIVLQKQFVEGVERSGIVG